MLFLRDAPPPPPPPPPSSVPVARVAACEANLGAPNESLPLLKRVEVVVRSVVIIGRHLRLSSVIDRHWCWCDRARDGAP